MASNGSMTEETPSVDVSQLPPELLAALGLNAGPQTKLTGVDDDVKYNADPKDRSLSVPQGMSMEQVASLATKKAAELNKVHTFTHFTKYRPDDGGYAAMNVIKRMFGLTVGKTIKSFFGDNPPEFRTIDIAYGKKVEIPWGHLEIPAMPGADIAFHAAGSTNGPVFAVQVEAPKKYKLQIEEFFNQLDSELATNSIYRGHALWGADELSFMNTKTFKANQIVFADDVHNTLEAAVFGLIEHTESTIAAGLPTKRAVLAFGPYGTGKTSLGAILAQRATAAGWTFLSAKAGKDKIKSVLNTAKLYEPAVVFIEDIDTHTPNAKDGDAISEILDLFDGIGSKDSKLLVVMTTNHIEKVPAGMLRPGRLDYIVEIAGLDRGGVERLVKAVVRKDLLNADVDYDAVYAECADWQPAWIKAVADRAQAFAIARQASAGEAALSYGLTTEDLVGAARSLQPQLGLMHNALEGYVQPQLNEVMERTIQESVKAAVETVAIVDDDDYKRFALTAEKPRVDWDRPRR